MKFEVDIPDDEIDETKSYLSNGETIEDFLEQAFSYFLNLNRSLRKPLKVAKDNV